MHGRFCDTTQVRRPSDVNLVNLALENSAPLSSAVIVQGRDAALTFMDRAGATVGHVKCYLVDELSGAHPPVFSHPSDFSPGDAVRVSDLVTPAPGCASASTVVQALLQKWVVVPTWQHALALLEHNKGRHGIHIITRSAPSALHAG